MKRLKAIRKFCFVNLVNFNMSRVNGLLLVIIVSGITLSSRVHGETLMSLKEYLKSELAGSGKLSKETFKLDDKQKKELVAIAENAQDTSFTFFYGKSEEGKLNKACTVVPQQGKEGPMTVGVCMDSSGLVSSVSVLTNEEERGKKALTQKFLNQFKAKGLGSSFQVGKDIDGVTGATVTSQAISEAVRKSVFAYKTFVNK